MSGCVERGRKVGEEARNAVGYKCQSPMSPPNHNTCTNKQSPYMYIPLQLHSNDPLILSVCYLTCLVDTSLRVLGIFLMAHTPSHFLGDERGREG